MTPSTPADLETDPRFPSGPWTGFFLQPGQAERFPMELHLTFTQGTLIGEGRDFVGDFFLHGRYELMDGRCQWLKRYVAKHDVDYQGFNEGKGIWGTWSIPPNFRGGFHIWPVGMPDPTQPHLVEAADIPRAADIFTDSPERELLTVG